VIVAFNLVLLFGLLILLLVEEVRLRRFSQHVQETRQTLAALSHQLRSPLTTIRKFNDFFRSRRFGKLSFGQAEALGRMESAMGEVIVLFNRLLAASRIEEAKLATHVMPVQLIENVQAAIDAVSALAAQKKHTLTFMENRKRIFVTVDPLLLHGVLDEILMNAISYTPEGGNVTVTIQEEKHVVTISVQDTGIGIVPEEQSHIFDKFFRGERAKTMHNGHGLGLSFAQQFAQKMGGSIRFTSTVGGGSTFTVTLPKATRPPAQKKIALMATIL